MEKIFAPLQMLIDGIVDYTVETVLRQISPIENQSTIEPTKQSSASEILNADQAAKFLHLAKQTLYTLTSKRKIPFYKNGKKILFKKDELQGWMDSGRMTQQEKPDIQNQQRRRFK